MTKDAHIAQLKLQLETERKYRDELEMVQRIIDVGLRALSLRMLTTFVLVADCILFAAALYISTWQALVAAVLFAVAGWCVLFAKPAERKVES